MKKLTKIIVAMLMMAMLLGTSAQVALADALIVDYPPVGYYVVVDAPDGYVNFRYDPYLGNNIICEIYNGTPLFVEQKSYYDSEIDSEWGMVEYGGYYGWISLSQVSSMEVPEPQTWEVNYDVIVGAPDGYVNLRDWQGLAGSIIFGINNGNVLHITEESEYDNEVGGGWGYTSYNGVNGWVSLSQTSPYTAPQPAAAGGFEFLDCTEEVKNNSLVKDFLRTFVYGYTDYNDSNSGKTYDFHTTRSGDANILANICGTPECADWLNYMVGTLDQHLESADPQGKFTGGYKVCYLSDLEWIARNVFNADQKAIEEFKANGFTDNNGQLRAYVDGDKVYSLSGGIGGPAYKFDIIKAHRINNLYFIEYEGYYEMNEPERYYAVLEEKSFNESPYWALYYNGKSSNWE